MTAFAPEAKATRPNAADGVDHHPPAKQAPRRDDVAPDRVLAKLDAKHGKQRHDDHQHVGRTDSAGHRTASADTRATISRGFRRISSAARRVHAQIQDSSLDNPARLDLVSEALVTVRATAGELREPLEHFEPHERKRFRGAAMHAAESVQALFQWTLLSATRVEIGEEIARTLPQLDQVFQLVGAQSLARSPSVAQHVANKEETNLETEANLLENALTARRERVDAALTRFAQEADLQDLESFSFIAEIVKAVLVAGLGHMFGAIARMAALPGATEISAKLVHEGATTIGRTVREVVSSSSEVVIDSSQTVISEAIAAADVAPTADPKLRARIFVQSALSEAETKAKEARLKRLDDERRRRTVTPAVLRSERLQIEGAANAVGELYRGTASTAWASILAQSRLGVHRGGRHGQGRAVSRMHDYFGVEGILGRIPRTDRSGGDGVLQVPVNLQLDVDEIDVMVAIGTPSIVGLNSVITRAVIDHAGGILGNVHLPKEIHVNEPFPGAAIALDERNRVRDAQGWNRLPTKLTDLRGFESPAAFVEKLLKVRF